MHAKATDGLLWQVIGSVLVGAQNGDLPLFAWTLGLPQAQQRALLHRHFPHLEWPDELPSQSYARLCAVPARFVALYQLLSQRQRSALPEQQRDWLCRATAAGCFGHQWLWRDLGLADRGALDALMAEYFAPLCGENPQHLPWKALLLAHSGANCRYPLGFTQGAPG